MVCVQNISLEAANCHVHSASVFMKETKGMWGQKVSQSFPLKQIELLMLN